MSTETEKINKEDNIYDSFREAMEDINNNSPAWTESEYALFINMFNEEYIL